MIGGPDSYGAGGYKRTPLEEALPVDMDVRDRERQPDIALVVVIDQSGSMDACHCNTANRDNGVAISGVPKVDIGKEAILRAVSALTERDEFGVVASTRTPTGSSAPRRSATSATSRRRSPASSPRARPTSSPGCPRRSRRSRTTTATRRHIVLFTDGWSSSGEYDDLHRAHGGGRHHALDRRRRRRRRERLPLRARAAGWRPLLRRRPIRPPSPTSSSRRPSRSPASRSSRRTFFPILTSSSPILRGLEEGLPQLRGYNGTTAKAAAQTVLVSSRDDPVLAAVAVRPRAGRSPGRADAQGRWAANWVGWDGFNQFFSQLVSWTFPGEESGGMEAEFVTDGDADPAAPARRSRPTARRATSTTRSVNITDPALGPARGAASTRSRPASTRPPSGTLDARRLRAALRPDASPARRRWRGP